MENDVGAYYLLVLTEPNGSQVDYKYDNAEAARKHARYNAEGSPNTLRHLFKMLPGKDPIEVMV